MIQLQAAVRIADIYLLLAEQSDDTVAGCRLQAAVRIH